MSERWHRQPTPLLGGVAVGLATLVGVGVAALLLGRTPSVTIGSTVTGKALGVGVSAALMLLRSEEHTSELQSRLHLVCRLLLEKKKKHVVTLYTIARHPLTL